MSHPKHPPMVHLPITTTLLTGGLDAVYFLSAYGPTSAVVNSALKTMDIAIPVSLLPTLSYYTTILTLLFSLPAVSTGAMELMPVIKRHGFSSQKVKVGVAHALINDVGLFGALYNWWSRRNVPGFTPSSQNMLVSVLLSLPAVLLGAYLGGSLVYQYGMGFQSIKAKKTQ